jgi:prepilin-type N-terminal cleavage/methylation domain-containing protein
VRTKSTTEGFTLIEILVTIAIAGILLSLGSVSLISMRKPLKLAVKAFESQVRLVRTQALSSGRAYRIRPRYLTTAEYSAGFANRFIVEHASNCSSTSWAVASQLDLDLEDVGVVDSSTILLAGSTIPNTNAIDWNLCFDNRGFVSNPVKIYLKDYRANNQARHSVFSFSKVGGITYANYAVDGHLVVDTQTPPRPSF